MSTDCYDVSKNCATRARYRVMLQKNRKTMKLLPAAATLEFLDIDFLGELIKTKRGFRFLLVITDRFRKLTHTVPLNSISAQSVEK